jgi:transposase InsO family protein
MLTRRPSCCPTRRVGCWNVTAPTVEAVTSGPHGLASCSLEDTFYWGTLKRVGNVYVQVIVDVFCSFAFAKVYTSKMPTTACDLLHDRVLPFYEQIGLTVGAVFTNNGRELCGKPQSHPYELFLGVEGIKHRTIKVRPPQTNGFVGRMNRTLLDECFRVQSRTKW